jgi:hypothetical protein
MLEKNATDRAVLLTPTNVVEFVPKFLLEKSGAFRPEAVGDWAGTREVIVVELGTRAFEVTVVVEKLKASEEMLLLIR